MFTGIDEVDWASLGHAYTDSATDVPDLLWGLASHDPARREIALDGMYGAVHHQGDVYDSTLACIPFLFELVTTVAVADRGAVVGLLRSIAGRPDEEEDAGPADAFGTDASEDGDEYDDESDESDESDEYEEWLRHHREAHTMVRDRAGGFLDLLDDPDPEVRAAVPGALAQLHPEPVRVLGSLRERLPGESDPAAARSLVRALGTLAVEHAGVLGAEPGHALRGVVSGAPDPELRLTALIQLARCAPALLPDDTLEIALEVMRLARAAKELGPPPAQPERPRTNTLISHVRELHAEHRRSLGLDEADELLTELHRQLGDRVDIRFPLLVAQLRSPDPVQRAQAVGMAGQLLTGWRAPDDEPVLALAMLLAEDDLRLHKSVLAELRYLAPVAHRVAEGLVAYIESWEDREPETGTAWRDTAVGKAFEVLTLQGDGRVVPALTSVLKSIEVPENLAGWIEALGPEAAAPLGPVLHDRLAALDHRVRGDAWSRLVRGLGALAHRASVPLLAEILSGTDDRHTRREVLEALTAYGRRGSAAAPRIRELWSDSTVPDEDRIYVAEALWAVAGEAGAGDAGAAEAALTVAGDALACGQWLRRDAGLRLAGALGPSGASLAPRLRELIAAGTEPARAAVALWRVTGEADEALAVLLDQWAAAPRSRPEISACLAELGPAAAPALPLIRAERSSSRRHNNTGGAGNMRYHVLPDVTLLENCRRVLDAFGEPGDEREARP
ncbi:HEAT repeat domain-containing protein [Streptomyces sp. NPDC020298]|uniref:HEAT repeat domain-containing protein n=1 Tax=unclassified Streptomyces TaxID=2593676 RepID=UPI0033D5DFAE